MRRMRSFRCIGTSGRLGVVCAAESPTVPADGRQAEEHLGGAQAIYWEMGMHFWLEQVEAALGPPDRNSP